LIDKADVVRINFPFPNIDPSLALQEHMFICIQEGNNKEFIKCQSFKPTHLLSSCPPTHYLIEEKNKNRNPFSKRTTIDCDKSFCVSCIILDKKLLAYRNVCKSLFNSILMKIEHSDFYKENIDPVVLCMSNYFIYPNK